MHFRIFIDKNNRLLSATPEKYSHGGIIVKKLPDGNLREYIFDGQNFIHSPEIPSSTKTTENLNTRVDKLEALYTSLSNTIELFKKNLNI